jgi:hypothetical protein
MDKHRARAYVSFYLELENLTSVESCSSLARLEIEPISNQA